MSNKQSSVELLFQDMLKLTTALIPEGKTRYELMKESYQHHKAMHKEEVQTAFRIGDKFAADYFGGNLDEDEQYYNETFGYEQQ